MATGKGTDRQGDHHHDEDGGDPAYSAALDWLYATQMFGVKLGLENMRRLVEALRIDLSPRRCIHVAGTNGKGSVCAFAEALARAAGHRTGLFTSPHLVSFRERIRIDGEPVAASRVTDGLELIRRTVSGWDPHPTFFEIATALALREFQHAGTGFVVLETGMGGRLDATNVVTPTACAITAIDLDHQQWLGSTLPEIAAEKAGIMKPGIPCVSAPQPEEVLEVLRRRATEMGAPLHVADRPLPVDWPLGLAGPHQRINAAVAVCAAQLAGLGAIQEPELRAALANTQWPGRFQRLPGGRVVLDGAHNPSAARALAATWRAEIPNRSPIVVFGAVNTKDVDGMLAELAPIARAFVFTRPDSPRALDPATFRSSRPSRTVVPAAAALRAALDWTDAPDAPVLVTGSLFLVGEVLAGIGSGTSGSGGRGSANSDGMAAGFRPSWQ